QLELFFDHRATNTSSLIELENKKIKELSLFTLGNSLLDDWSLNPWALRNVEWVNTIDYNVSWENKQGADIASRITFNTIAFEESDILKDHADPAKRFERINNGLRMAY
ncbi:putative immunoglobulin-blocking virulence protein, partial [Mycoplasmopsis bovis]